LISEARIPAFARADEDNAVAGVLDDIAAVMKMNRELLGLLRGLRKHDLEIVIASDAALLEVHPFVLEISERVAPLVGNGFCVKSAGELKCKYPLAGMFSTQVDGCCSVEGVIRQNGGVHGVIQRVEYDWWRNGAGDAVGSPNIVVDRVAGFPALAEKDLLSPLKIEEEIEGTGFDAFERCMKIGLWILRKAIFEEAQGLRRIELRDVWVRERSEPGVQLRGEIGGMELAEEIVRGVIGEAHVGAEEYLVQNGSSQKMRHLLFFHDIARESQGMAAAGEDEACDVAVDGGQESEFAFFEVDFNVAAAEFDTVGGHQLVGGSGIETQGIERVVEFVRRRRGGGRDGRRKETPQDRKCHTWPHARSVVTFGIAEQGRGGQASEED